MRPAPPTGHPLAALPRRAGGNSTRSSAIQAAAVQACPAQRGPTRSTELVTHTGQPHTRSHGAPINLVDGKLDHVAGKLALAIVVNFVLIQVGGWIRQQMSAAPCADADTHANRWWTQYDPRCR